MSDDLPDLIKAVKVQARICARMGSPLSGAPLRGFEIAASAGLNLSWDRYCYRLGDASWGDPAAAVELDTDWTGPAPPVDARVEVVERAACDRRPSGLSSEAERRRLMAY